jgi:excisionase family DNA binding protein
MLPMLTTGTDIISPTSADTELAKTSSRSIATRLGMESGSRLELRDDATGEIVELPTPALRALFQVLTEMGQGHSVTVTPIHSELSLQQAAELLNVSRAYLKKLVDDGAIASRKTGYQPRLLLNDVIALKKVLHTEQLQGMAELTNLTEELGLYDEPAK